MLLQVKNAVAEEWFKAAGKSLAEVQQQINHSGKPASFAFPPSLQLSLKIDIEPTHARVNNVVAYLPGKSDEYIVLGAHYDHLGRGDSNSLAPSQIGQIHPGADDNASGTAGLLQLARMLAPLKGQLDRGILFLSFSGEELGLLGSAEWAKHPTLPLNKCAAMINMDMIGRIRNEKVYVGGVGTGSTFKPILEAGAEEIGFQDGVFGRRLRGQRSHFVCRAADSGAVLLLRPACRLSQALRHVGQDQRAVGGEAARPDRRCRGAVGRRPQPPAFVTVVEDKPSGGVFGPGGYGRTSARSQTSAR